MVLRGANQKLGTAPPLPNRGYHLGLSVLEVATAQLEASERTDVVRTLEDG